MATALNVAIVRLAGSLASIREMLEEMRDRLKHEFRVLRAHSL